MPFLSERMTEPACRLGVTSKAARSSPKTWTFSSWRFASSGNSKIHSGMGLGFLPSGGWRYGSRNSARVMRAGSVGGEFWTYQLDSDKTVDSRHGGERDLLLCVVPEYCSDQAETDLMLIYTLLSCILEMMNSRTRQTTTSSVPSEPPRPSLLSPSHAYPKIPDHFDLHCALPTAGYRGRLEVPPLLVSSEKVGGGSETRECGRPLVGVTSMSRQEDRLQVCEYSGQ